MKRLSLCLLGPYHITLDEEPITEFRSDKVRALLAYLAVEADGPHRRDALAGLFWPDVPDRTARKNLRLTLHRLRDALDDLETESAYFRITRETIQVRPAAIWVDAVAFADLIAGSRSHDHRRMETCAACAERLAEAAALYRGDFLQGFFLDDCLAFSEWALLKREEFHRQVLPVLYHLAEHHRRRGELERGRVYATRQLELEPWREEAHRQLMDILARGGETSAALAQYQTCRRALAEELKVEPDRETDKLYERIRLIRAGPRHNLPPQATPFIGRQKELARVADLLVNPDCRLLTIVGPGGIGKTRLAIQAARAVAGERARLFLNGVTYVPLAGIEASESLIPAIADALGLSFHGSEEPGRQLIDHLRRQEKLLLLDNFEQLHDGATFLLELLEQAKGIKLLVTSRERLNVHWEWLLPLAGLPYPEGDATTMGRGESQAYDAVRLFQTCAQRSHPGFELEGETERGVVHICQAVEGMPLAVELAAAWVGSLSMDSIVTEITHDLSFSATAVRHLPARHRSLRAVFDHTWQALTEEERLVFAQLSVFRSGFTREAALAVISDQLPVISNQSSVISGQTDHRSLITDHCSQITDHWLPSLVGKSLLRLLPSGRYEMHELLRQYAAEKLAAVPDVQIATRDRHCAYYATFLQRQEADLVRAGAAEALATLKAEMANVRAAWRWAVEQARLEEMGRSLGGLSHFYLLAGPFQHGERLIRMAVDRVQALADISAAPGRDEQVLLSRLLTQQARFLSRRGAYDQAIAAAQLAIDTSPRRGSGQATKLSADVARTTQAVRLEAEGYLQWGRALWHQGEYDSARRQFEQALSLARAASLHHVEADSLGNLGVVCFNQADYRRARAYYEQALRRYREIGGRRGEGMALGNLGLLFNRQGDYGRAASCYRQALRVFQEISDRQCEGLAFSNLGLLAHRQGDDDAARRFSQQALDIAQELGERNLQGYALTHLGHALMGLGHLAEAATAYWQAQALRRELGQPNLAMESLAGLARVSLAQDDLTQAQAQVEEILAHMEINTPSIDRGHGPSTGPSTSSGEASGHGLEGTVDPLQVYLTCYRVLCANQDARAEEVLETAHAVLQEQASKIDDSRLRRSFLENVPAHREIVAEVRRMKGE
ncbi:MAG: tetratricopeptide repeat protein [Anaerolineae bacterium]